MHNRALTVLSLVYIYAMRDTKRGHNKAWLKS